MSALEDWCVLRYSQHFQYVSVNIFIGSQRMRLIFVLQNKKWEETSKKLLLDFVESSVGRTLGAAERNLIIHGADEVDIVRSGLDDTMTTACAETRKSALEKVSIL